MIDNELLSRAQDGDVVAQFEAGLYYATEENGDLDYAKAAAWYLKAANAGHAKAQNALANILIDGEEVVEQNVEQAIRWYSESAKQGNAAAQYNLGNHYYLGKRIPKDYEKAIYWLEKAAEQDDEDAYFRLGCCYEFGYNNHEEAAKMWQIASEKNHIGAMYQLGMLYREGAGVEENNAQAFLLFEKSATLENEASMYMLGECFQYGWGVAKNMEKAFEWYYKAAEAGDESGQFELGLWYQQGVDVPEDKEKAFFWFQKAAENGYALSMYSLGACYMRGIGTDQDYESAFRWYKKSSEGGCALPNYYLGQMYQKGIGTSVDYDKAIQYYKEVSEDEQPEAFGLIGVLYAAKEKYDEAYAWFVKAAELGNGESMYKLGLCYMWGDGASQDYEMAFHWLTTSVENGCGLPHYFLGQMYHKGIGTSIDYDKAIQHYKEASEDEQSEAFGWVGALYAAQDRNDEAYNWFVKAAELGNVDAMLQLSNIHWERKSGKDVGESAAWAEKAADAGSPQGMILAYLRWSMIGHAQVKMGGVDNPITVGNLEKAKMYLELALQNGYDSTEARKTSDSLFRDLGDCYFSTDRKWEAFECYKQTSDPKAAIYAAIVALDNALSPSDTILAYNRLVRVLPNKELAREDNGWGYHMLGLMLENGIGTQQSSDEAYLRFVKANEFGFDEAAKMLRRYKKKLFGGYEYIG